MIALAVMRIQLRLYVAVSCGVVFVVPGFAFTDNFGFANMFPYAGGYLIACMLTCFCTYLIAY